MLRLIIEVARSRIINREVGEMRSFERVGRLVVVVIVLSCGMFGWGPDGTSLSIVRRRCTCLRKCLRFSVVLWINWNTWGQNPIAGVACRNPH